MERQNHEYPAHLRQLRPAFVYTHHPRTETYRLPLQANMDMLIDDRALDDEEDDESFDEETGEVRKKTNGENKHFDDSSEEEDDDDDEEAAAEVAKGFIVDEDEELDEDAKAERRRERKKRRREEREDEGLDEEDLELIGMKPVQDVSEPKFKRLKRGPREDEERRPVGVTDIFADEDEEEVQDYAQRANRYDRRGPQDEFDDFIEEDVFSDDEQARQQEDMEVARPNRRGMPDLLGADVSGLDEEAPAGLSSSIWRWHRLRLCS